MCTVLCYTPPRRNELAARGASARAPRRQVRVVPPHHDAKCAPRPAEPPATPQRLTACSLYRRDLTVPHGASTEERVRQRDGLPGLLALLGLLPLGRASLVLQHGLLRDRGPLDPAVSPRVLWGLLPPGMRLALAVGGASPPSTTHAWRQDLDLRPVHMFFDREKDAQKILDGAFAHAGLEIKQGRMAGSPERLNLFTSDGDVLRLDLDIDAHLGGTLHPSSVLILEKGNRIADGRLETIKRAMEEQAAAASCAVM